MRYMSGLAAAIERRGGQIFTGTRAKEIKGGTQACVKTEQGKTITVTVAKAPAPPPPPPPPPTPTPTPTKSASKEDAALGGLFP